uniref:Uncharacterized protein n=1 Tax=viral metagenome TaxID=1070528 RepID=A0A6H2A4C4_9ZZZZ
MAEKREEEIRAEAPPSGIKFTKAEAEIKPPAEVEEEAPPLREIPPEERVARAGRVPLHPAVIRLPASILGRIGTELTGYPGFTFTEQEINDLAELWIQCGVMTTPLLQAAIGTTAMVGGKALGYLGWVKAGKPSIAGAEAIGKETSQEEGK